MINMAAIETVRTKKKEFAVKAGLRQIPVYASGHDVSSDSDDDISGQACAPVMLDPALIFPSSARLAYLHLATTLPSTVHLQITADSARVAKGFHGVPFVVRCLHEGEILEQFQLCLPL